MKTINKIQTPKFNLISKSSYLILISSFLSAFILFLVLSLVHNHRFLSNATMYTLLGTIVYCVGNIIFVRQNNKKEKQNPEHNHKNFFLKFLTINTFVYLMLSWFLMILVGAFKGFGIHFQNYPNINALVLNYTQVWIAGLILFFITLFLGAFLFWTYKVFFKFFKKANTTFDLRRKMVEKVRSKAKTEVE